MIAAAEGRVDGARGRRRTQRCHVRRMENVKYRIVYYWFAEGVGLTVLFDAFWHIP